MIRLVSEVVKVHSITGEEAKVAFLFQRRMKKLGFDAEIYEMRGHNVPPPGRASVPAAIYGPGGDGESGGSFSPPERIKIDDLAAVAKVYTLSALDICTKDRSGIEPRLRLPVSS